MNIIFFLPQLISKLLGFVFCFVLFSGESWSQLLAILHFEHSCVATCSYCLWTLVTFKSLLPYIGVTFICSLLPKQKLLASYKINNYLLSGNVHSLPFYPRWESGWESKNESRALAFVTSRKVNFIFRQCFWGWLQRREKEKSIVSDWLLHFIKRAHCERAPWNHGG